VSHHRSGRCSSDGTETQYDGLRSRRSERVADGGTTRAFDRTKHPVEFVFNPKPPDKTKVLLHVIVVNTEDADTLLGMSVLGKIGLTANPYKGHECEV
jgi:hypothetical protein